MLKKLKSRDMKRKKRRRRSKKLRMRKKNKSQIADNRMINLRRRRPMPRKGNRKSK